MSFIYPLFLAAAAALAIPVLIHLFNLRRYKTVYFPHTRFLKNIQLRSQKQSQLRYKLLLTFRLLFLASLILAFAQPYFSGSAEKDNAHRLQAIYIDNSGSMSLKKGELRLVDMAKQAAIRQIKAAGPGTKFILLTNDNPVSYRPMPADKALQEINNIEITTISKNAAQIFSLLQGITGAEGTPNADLYYYSDFQQTAIGNTPANTATENIRVYAVPFAGSKSANIFIDTAYLAGTVLQTNESNELVVRTKLFGDEPANAPVLNLGVNGQVKSAATINFAGQRERVDTLTFRVSDAGWQKIELVIDDESVKFDDTFRITARSAPSLSVLVLNETAPSPYIQAAFRAYNGFRLTNAAINNPPADWKEYSLVVFNGITSLSEPMGAQIAKALQQGQSICVLPGRTPNVNAFNDGLKAISDISVTGIDTATQAAVSLQEGNDLVRNLFESIPNNVQLPVANWHYIIRAGLSANGQSILGFRSGDHLLAQYSTYAGKLYMLSGGIDMQSGDFATGYFFAPFLYQVAVQSNGGNVYALSLGSRQPAFLPLDNNGERNMVRLYDNGIETIPTQQTYGAGLNVFIDDVVKSPGFYPLSVPGKDTTIVAVNMNRSESQLTTIDADELSKLWPGVEVRVIDAERTGATASYNRWGGFPLWKVCVILALIMLVAETWVLAGSLRKPSPAAQ